MRPGRPSGRAPLGRLLALLAVAALASAACGETSATPSPDITSVAILPTPFANGTVGRYGLHIDPKLLKRLPIAVGGITLTEDTLTEQTEMDDQALTMIDSLAAANYNQVGDDNWLLVEVVHFKTDSQNGDAFGQWIDEYATAACSQAGGVSNTGQETINTWLVDEATCVANVEVYSLSLGDGTYVSMFGLGPRNLGKLLIQNLF